MGSENEGSIKELLVLQFGQWRSKNKELLEPGLELASIQKQRVFINSYTTSFNFKLPIKVFKTTMKGHYH